MGTTKLILLDSLLQEMTATGYTWAQPSSLTAVKYQRHGFVEERPFLPGERFSVARDMERNVKGYKEVSRELALARQIMDQQKKTRRDQTLEKTVQTSCYKSVVGTRSSKGSGGMFYSNPVGRVGYFSNIKRV